MLFKVLDAQGRSCHGGSGQWHLPKGDKPGKWMPAIEGVVVPCKNGYHLCREQDLLTWLGESIWEAEARGDRVDVEDKVVVRQARLLRRLPWDERTARLFACDCAEHVLQHAGSARAVCEATIGGERRYADGKATREELAAAGAAARAAAWAAERAWQTRILLGYLYPEATDVRAD